MSDQSEARAPTGFKAHPDYKAQVAAVEQWLNITEFGIVKIFIDFKVFETLPDEEPMEVSKLAEAIGGEVSIVERLSNFLIKRRILTSPKPGYLAQTETSRGYKTGTVSSLLTIHIFNTFMRPVSFWPEYFEKNGLQEPKDPNVIPLGLGMGHPNLDFFETIKTDEKKEKLFDQFMASIQTLVTLKGIYDFTWVKEVIERPENKDRAIVVDIAGGKGQGLKDILDNYDFIEPSRCAILDRPTVIEENARGGVEKGLESVQLIPGDMFKPNPLKGAVIYRIARACNDWPDDWVITAMKQVRDAAAPDTRLIIVEELLLPREKATQLNLSQDLYLMNSGGKRRNEKMFNVLAEKSGWKILKTHIVEGKDCGVVELVLADA